MRAHTLCHRLRIVVGLRSADGARFPPVHTDRIVPAAGSLGARR
jgi:hypothetical protein